MHSRRNNLKLTSYIDTDEVVDGIFESLWSRYQGNLETSMRGNYFISNSVQLVYYKCNKVNYGPGGSCIDSPDWIKKKKATTNPKNTDHKCFQYVGTVALNYEEIESHPERC